MLPKESINELTSQPRWPDCPTLGGQCLLYQIAQVMGKNIFDTMVTFVLRAETGSRLSLQRNRDEFTVQITGAVQRTATDTVDLTFLQGLQQKLEQVNGQPGAVSTVSRRPGTNGLAS